LELPLNLLEDFDAATERELVLFWRRKAVDAEERVLGARETAKDDCFDCRANFDG
jgi:hypothetical protein